MNIQREESEYDGKYSIKEGKQEIAEITYNKEPNRIIINHTFVSPEQRGKGLAEKLVKAAVEDARTNKISIIPICSYARKYFNDHQEDQDVL